MADNKMVETIKRSLLDFNKYRAANPAGTVDLSGANFCGANLSSANSRAWT
jgi:uncharacterized protein YjbI with pentapeptide repeats